MLIDFTVENFLSIKEPVTLSAIAMKKSGKRVTNSTSRSRIPDDETIGHTTEFSKFHFSLLPVLGIFGANASGKSNVLKALDRFLMFVRFGSRLSYEDIDIVPFRLSSEYENKPSKFTLRVIIDDAVYTYMISLNRDRIYDEALYYSSSPKSVSMYYKRHLDDNNVYQWQIGSKFNGPHNQIKDFISNKESYLNILIDKLSVPELRSFGHWLLARWPGVGLERESVDAKLAASFLHKYSYHSKNVSKIMRMFDTGIEGIEVFRNDNESEDDSLDKYHVLAVKKCDEKDIKWPIELESMGTQRLMIMAMRILLALEEGAPLIVDELGSNLHPLITRSIIKAFQEPTSNLNQAQLIFSSHDNALYRDYVLRRDEIWFTSKNDCHATELFPLSDFNPRNDMAIDKAYLDGRFGAIPVIAQELVFAGNT